MDYRAKETRRAASLEFNRESTRRGTKQIRKTGDHKITDECPEANGWFVVVTKTN
jgi:hypothetical protein